MSKPSRPSAPANAAFQSRTFFAATRTADGKSLFQTERMANLLIDVLRSNMRASKLTVHAFALMPDHVHILLTVPAGLSLEKAIQLKVQSNGF